jgi:hypothetical protein
LRRQLEEHELVVRQSPASKGVNTEAEEADISLILEVPVSNLCTDTDVGSKIWTDKVQGRGEKREGSWRRSFRRMKENRLRSV